MQAGQGLAINLHAQAGCAGHAQAAVFKRQAPALHHLVVLPGVVRVAGVRQLRHRRRQVGHGHQADAQVRVRVHRQAQAEGLAHQRQALRGAQAAPVVVVGEHDLHRATHVGVAAEFLEIGDDHVGGQRHVARGGHGGHAVQARGRVFVVLQHAAQLFHHLQAGGHGPVGVGVDAQRCTREGMGQCQQGSHFLLRWQRAGLELDAPEAVLINHAARLRHHLFGRDALAERVGRVGLVDVFGVLEKQVGRERHGRARRAAQQVHHRRVGQLALQIHHRHFEGADHLGHRLGDVRARCQ